MERESCERQQDTRTLIIIPNSPPWSCRRRTWVSTSGSPHLPKQNSGRCSRLPAPATLLSSASSRRSYTVMKAAITRTSANHSEDFKPVWTNTKDVSNTETNKIFPPAPPITHQAGTRQRSSTKGIGSKAKRLFLESAMIRSVINFNPGLHQRGDFNLSLFYLSTCHGSTLRHQNTAPFPFPVSTSPRAIPPALKPLICVFGITLQGRWLVNRN